MKLWKRQNWLKGLLLILLTAGFLMVSFGGGLLLDLFEEGYYDTDFDKEGMIEDALYRQVYDTEMYNMFWRYADVVVAENTTVKYTQDKYNMSASIYTNDSEYLLYQNYSPNRIGDNVYVFEIYEQFLLPGELMTTELSGYIIPGSERSVELRFVCVLDRELKADDVFRDIADNITFMADMRVPVLWITGIGVMLTLIAFICLLRGAGHVVDSEEIHLRWFDKIPLDIYWVILGGIVAVLGFVVIEVWGFFIFDELYLQVDHTWMLYWGIGSFGCTVMMLLTAEMLITLSIRIKYGSWWKNTLLYRICLVTIRLFRLCKDALKYVWKHIAWVWQLCILFAGLCLLEYGLLYAWGGEDIGVILLLDRVVLLAAGIFLMIGFGRLRQCTKRLADGDLTYKADTQYLWSGIKMQMEDLNRIGEGMQTAVSEKVKSERFKTELITNVSHDIKTPLTSIINYVDLLKKQPLTEKSQEYVEVLDRQSDRLKKLLEDLMEASKVSTGNIKADLQPMHPAVFLHQCAAEYVTRFEEKGLQMVFRVEEESGEILADGRLYWRVLDNLLSNIHKYALENTRVYLDMAADKEDIVIALRNISKYQMDVLEEELTERFIRGDISRHTEGSGLGLSIASDLVKLQGGSMKIMVDGDLFKVEIRFAKYQ